MTNYYVRKTGSDANDGTNPTTQAWLTIDKAANTVAAADNVYVGAGVYRELVTMDTSGSSGSQISFIADVDGEQTGDAGLVIISAYAPMRQARRRGRSALTRTAGRLSRGGGSAWLGGQVGLFIAITARTIITKGAFMRIASLLRDKTLVIGVCILI
jgi:hypothetical protein